MSNAEEAEREIEDLFNEEILGLKEPERDEAPFPTEAPPESKPVEEIADPDEAPEEETPAEELPGEETPPEFPPQEEPAAEEPQEEPYLTWAKKKYGLSDEQLQSEATQLLAKSGYEQERMLGKQAEESRRREQEQERQAILAQIEALHSYGMLTPQEDAWIDEKIMGGDIQEAVQAVLQNDRLDLFTPLIERFSAQSDEHARFGNWVRSQALQALTAAHLGPQPSAEERYRAEYAPIFGSVGLDLDLHGPIVLAKAQELGGHYAYALEHGDEGQRRVATRALFDLASATQTEVSKARLDDAVAARVQEEKLRQNAAGVTQGGTRAEPKKKDPFWDSYNEEVEERGWDGNTPRYGSE